MLYFACATGKLGGLFVDFILGVIALVLCLFVLIPLLAAMLVFLIKFLVSLGLFTSMKLSEPEPKTEEEIEQENLRKAERRQRFEDTRAAIEEHVKVAGLGLRELIRFATELGAQTGSTLGQRYLEFIRFFVRGQKRPILVGFLVVALGSSYWHFAYGIFRWPLLLLTTCLVASLPLLIAILCQGGKAEEESGKRPVSALRVALLVVICLAGLYTYRDQILARMAEQKRGSLPNEVANSVKPPTLKGEACSKTLQEISTKLEIYSVDHSGTYPKELSEVGSWNCPVAPEHQYVYTLKDSLYKLSCSSDHWQKQDEFVPGYPFFHCRSGWALSPTLWVNEPPHRYVQLHGTSYKTNS